MRKLIATYRFQIAFIVSLTLHLIAFVLCPHFGGEQGNPQNVQTVDVCFEESHTTNDSPHFEEAVLTEEVSPQENCPKEEPHQEAVLPTPSLKPSPPKKIVKHRKAKQRAGESKTSGDHTGLEVFPLEQATLLKRLPLPSYPALARKRGLEGSVTVQVLIDSNGLIKDIKVIHYEGPDLFVKTVLSTIQRQWQGVFAPHKKGGVYMDGWVEVTIPFRLRP